MFDRDLKARRMIDAVEERLDKLERLFHQLELEWGNTLDKLTRMQQRIVKRAEAAEAARAEIEEAEEPTDGQLPLQGHAAKMNAFILQRRGRGGTQ